MNEQPAKKKRNIVRSPSYPSINIQKAIELSKIIKEKESGGQHFAPYQAIFEHWEYGKKSSSARLHLAALKKYGLIEDQGFGKKREIKLSDLALRIIFYEENNDEKEYIRAIQKAALNPKIHEELWSKYGGIIPSDQTLRTYLILNREEGKFNEKVANYFIGQFKATISFAKLDKHDMMSGHEEDKIQSNQEEEKMNDMPDNQTNNIDATYATEIAEIPIILSKSKKGRMQIPYPLSEEEWNRMLTMLNAYKPSLMDNGEETEE